MKVIYQKTTIYSPLLESNFYISALINKRVWGFFLRTLQRGVKTNLFSLAGYKGEQEINFKCKEHLGLILKYTSTGFAL